MHDAWDHRIIKYLFNFWEWSYRYKFLLLNAFYIVEWALYLNNPFLNFYYSKGLKAYNLSAEFSI